MTYAKSTLALEGKTILDLTELLPGPFATQTLIDMGARVIKIEKPTVGDAYRKMRGSSFRLINRGKKSIALDLKSESGREVLKRLAVHADSLIEGYRPGVMNRLGVGYEVIKAVNPQIIYMSITGFGQSGPLRDFPGHDLNYNAVAGVLGMCGRSEHPQHALGIPLADLSGSLYAITSLLAAFLVRQQTGVGQFLDVALTDSALAMVGPRIDYSKRDILYRAGNNVYQTGDDRYIAVAALEDHFWSRLVKVLAVPELSDPLYAQAKQRWPATSFLDPIIERKILEKNADEWLKLFFENDVPATAISEGEAVFDQPQLRERGMFIEADGIRYVNYPVRMQGVEADRHTLSPALGEHTNELLEEIGYTADEIAALRAEGVCTGS